MISTDMNDQDIAAMGEKNFKGRDIKGGPLRRSAMGGFADVRAGRAEIASLPIVSSFNHHLQDRQRALVEGRINRRDREELEALRSLLIGAGSGDQQMMAELASYRVFELSNDVMASPWALAAFQQIDLSKDEMPMIVTPRSKNMQRFNVNYYSLDGGAQRDQWRTTKSATTMEMNMIATDRVEYSLFDLNQGDVNEFASIQQAIQYDMEMKIDTYAKAAIDAASTASGLRALLSIHPNVVSANIPDKNYLDLTATNTNHKLTIGKLKTILQHMLLFGSAGGADEQFGISTVMLSPQNLTDSWDFVDLVAGYNLVGAIQDPQATVTEDTRQAIFQSGMMTSAWGQTFSWTPNSQLDLGRMYILSTQPLGWFFTKTEYDKMLKWDETNSPNHAENNVGEVMWRRPAKFVVPDLYKHRVLIVDL